MTITSVPETSADSRRWKIRTTIAICQPALVLDSSVVTIAMLRAQHDLGISDTNQKPAVARLYGEV